MSNLQSVIARREAIIAERRELDREEADLVIAERVLRKLAGEIVPIAAKPVIPTTGQSALAASLLPADGGTVHRTEFRKMVETSRQAAMTDNAFATMLSRLATGGVIVRDGEYVRRADQPVAEGGDNVS